MGDTLIHAELLAACSALGYSDGVKYHCEADCLETTKDLVRYLRRDDDHHEVRLALGDTRVLQTDLLPLVRDYSEEKEQFDVTIRLLVNLTNPVLLLFHEELPEEKVTRQKYLRLITQQQGYKEAFVEEKVWSVLVGRLGELLQLDWESREEEDRLLVERILILIRNVLAVPASPEDEKRTDDDASVHDQVLWALHLAGLEDLLLYIASSHAESDLCMHVLEIISLMLREQDPSQLASAGLHRSEQEKEKDEKELLAVRQREAVERQKQRSKQYSARHSRFGGTYYIQNMKSISERDLIAHQPLKDITAVNFDRLKKPKKHPKHRVPLRDSTSTRRSTLAIRLFLQEFCIEFLNGAYNSIMYIVKDNLNQARAQEHDESYYLWAMKFFMAFNRHHQFKIELISETLSTETFHYIQTQLDSYYENMSVDKKKIPLWSRRMHKAIRAYQELLSTLAAMDKCQIEGVSESSRVLKSKVFYVVEYRELVLVLLQNYDPLKMPLTYLKDVIETTHIFLKLLEGFCSKNNHIVVQRKKKKNAKKKGKGNAQGNELTEEKLQEIWDEMSSELSAVVQGEAGELPDTVPFDALSEEPEEEQKEAAMRRVNLLLRRREILEAVSLLRSARELWPEGDVFGSETMDHSEEFLALREIFMANLNPQTQESVDEVDEEFEEEEEEEEERRVEISEQEFSFQSFIRRFANSKVMEGYCRLLQDYQTNASHTNHCILKLFHRLAWDCKMAAIFFQASLFNTFQNVLEETRISNNETVREIGRFAKYIIRQFFKTAETNPKVFMEILFWKNNQEALEIETGYDVPKTKNQNTYWLEEEEDELRRLYEEMSHLSQEELGDEDIADHILKNLINPNRSRRGVIKKLKDLGIIREARDLKNKKSYWLEEEELELRDLYDRFSTMSEEERGSEDILVLIKSYMINQSRTRSDIKSKLKDLGLITNLSDLNKRKTGNFRTARIWTEEQEGELRMLFEENKDAIDIVGRIMDHMIERRPKHRVIEKILELGLVSDRKELRKKQTKKPKKNNTVDTRSLGERFLAANQEEEEEIIDSSDESEGEESEGESDKGKEISHISSRKSKKSTGPISSTPTPALISKGLGEVLGAGMKGPVEWLSGILKEVADDREEDGDFEPVPIFALSEDCSDAMDDARFQKLLKLVGLQPPKSHEEMYWRVPSNLSVPALRKRASYLTQGINGELEVQENDRSQGVNEANEGLSLQNAQNSSDQNSATENLELKNGNANDLTNGGDTDEDLPLLTLSSASHRQEEKKREKSKKRRVIDDSDSEIEEKGSQLQEEKKKKRMIEESEEEEEEGKKKEKRRMMIEDSDSEIEESGSQRRKEKKKKRQLIHDSDSDIEESVSQSQEEKKKKREMEKEGKKNKKRRVMMTDDSDIDGEIEPMESQNLVLHLDTEQTEEMEREKKKGGEEERGREREAVEREEEKGGRKVIDSDDDDDIPLFGGRQRKAVIESDDE